LHGKVKEDESMNLITTRIIDLAIAIQQIPAPTFHEQKRGEFVQARLVEEGLADVTMDRAGNVFGRLAGTNREKMLVVSAHLDTVFPLSVDLHLEQQPDPRVRTGFSGRILGPGIGDNSLGVAGLFGLVWALRELKLTLPGDLWLVANVSEEGLGDLGGMRAVVDRFGPAPIGYIILEGMALGQITHRGLGVRRIRIRVRTAGGHSWIDAGRPSAIHELVTLSTRLTGLELPHQPRSTLNIGVISGGSSVNTIAAEAVLELDLRAESGESLEALAGQVGEIVRAANKAGVAAELETIGNRPYGELPAEHGLVRLAQECLRGVGVEPHLNIGSTDANLPLSRGLPAITVGLTSGGRAHSVEEFINVGLLEKGIEQLVHLVRGTWSMDGSG
jgi:tripeptide aminopeptidase